MISFYRKDYPRPQFVREAWKSLNGPWDFAFDDANRGEVLLWPKQFPKEKRTIQVPFTYETPQSGIGDTSVHNYVWYHRQVDLSQWKGQRLLLHFEGADYCTKVWADGEYLGMHQGGYSRFSFDISAFAGKPSVELVVKVWDSLDADQPRGKQRYKKESWGCWYVQSTGIWKTVWLEAVGENYLASVEMTPDVEKKSLALQMEAAISDEAFTAHRFQLCCEIGLEGRPIASHTRDITNPVEKIILSSCFRPKNGKPSPNSYEKEQSGKGQIPLACVILSIDKEEERGENAAMGLRADGREQMQLCLDYMESHLCEPLTAERLSRFAGYSVYHFCRLFHAAVGLPVRSYLVRRRLLHAAYAIGGGESLFSAALDCGFSTEAAFCSTFRKREGRTPSQYRKDALL